MGSSYFYLEFLLIWLSLLNDTKYRNPALFALEYTLVPDAVYPTQLQQAIVGYNYVLSITGDASRICVSGDSAGATLVLGLLLHIASDPDYKERRPGLAMLISPWATLVSPRNRNTPSDYLNAESLQLYGSQYAGSKAALDDPLVSPGTCKDTAWWLRASPTNGFVILYGSEEVFAPETRSLILLLRNSGCHVESREEQGSIHAWPVATLFLSDSKEQRTKGVAEITESICRLMA